MQCSCWRCVLFFLAVLLVHLLDLMCCFEQQLLPQFSQLFDISE
jgi:hypothetical protein